MLEGARGRVSGLTTNYRTPDDIPRLSSWTRPQAFLSLQARARRSAETANRDASYDDQDEPLLQKIDAALAGT